MSDLINRQDAIDVIMKVCKQSASQAVRGKFEMQKVPSAQPDNQINLCDSCDYPYPDCPSKNDDVIFGNGIGNDNICACNKYKPSAQPERKTGRWKRTPTYWVYCSECGSEPPNESNSMTPYCPNCGAKMDVEHEALDYYQMVAWVDEDGGGA